MTIGLIAFFVTLSVLAIMYALLAPNNTKAKTFEETSDAGVSGGFNTTRVGYSSNDNKTLFEQWVRPAIHNFLPQTPMALTEYAQKSEGIRSLLAKTNNPWKVSPEEYVVFRILAIMVGTILGIVLSLTKMLPFSLLVSMGIGGFLGYYVPYVLLKTAWAKRRRDLNKNLPEALDLLRICMNAGYSFPNALKETTALLPPGTTREELIRVGSEIDAGKTLHDALSSFAYRSPTDGVEAFVRAINQASTIGGDISETLGFQASEARNDYERKVEARAQKLQTTLFLPIIGCMLPSMLIFLFGPAISGISQGL